MMMMTMTATATKTNKRVIRPQPGPQETFLASSADIAVYGGAAGGGKTYALLLECLRHIGNPRFGAVVFRRESPQITNEGGLWDASERIYGQIPGAEGVRGLLTWRFSSGAKITFRHLIHERSAEAWQGTEVPLIAFDELTHFTDRQFFTLISRSRSTCGVAPYVRATCNPHPGWVRALLGPWVDRRHPLYPTPPGALRYMTRVDGQITWVEPDWRDEDGQPGKSVTFVRASIYDNRALLATNPEYLATLRALPPVERARLLDGDWDVTQEGLVYPDFRRAIVEPDAWPALDPTLPRFGGIDWGYHNPFAAVSGVLDGDGVLWVDACRYASHRLIPEHIEALRQPPWSGCRQWWADPSRPESIAECRRADLPVVPCTHLGARPRMEGIGRVSQRLAAGRLKIRGDLGPLIEEAAGYVYPQGSTGARAEEPVACEDHALDALRYLCVGLDRMLGIDHAPAPTPPAPPPPLSEASASPPPADAPPPPIEYDWIDAWDV